MTNPIKSSHAEGMTRVEMTFIGERIHLSRSRHMKANILYISSPPHQVAELPVIERTVLLRADR